MSKNIEVKVLGGADLPDDVKEELAEKFAEILGGKPKADGMEAMLAGLFGSAREAHEHTLKPASRDQAMGLIDAASTKLAMGDVVVLRDEAAHYFKYPQAGERVIVTQVLDTPVRDGDSGSRQAKPNNIAIAMTCPAGHVHEFLHDSRDFMKVGSIFN